MAKIKDHKKEFVQVLKSLLTESTISFSLYELTRAFNEVRNTNTPAVTSRTMHYVVNYLKKEGSHSISKCLIREIPYYTFEKVAA